MKHTYKGTTYDCPDRDNRRAKCYAGERAAFGPAFFELIDGGDLRAATAFANHVIKSKTWFRLRKDHDKVNDGGLDWVQIQGLGVKDGRGRRTACASGSTIELPRWARTKPVILHELAHVLVGGGRGHNWPFNRAYIDLVNVFLGREWGTKLERELKKAGCRTKPKHPIDPARLALLRERGRALAAMMAQKRKEVGP